MPARAIASGTVTFGLVSIPVKLYSATQSKTVRFSMLHAKDKARLKQHYTCSACGETVPRDQTVKGYEHARDQYVVVSEEELGALLKKSDRTIEIEEFVPIEKVDPIYFEHSNLLGPDKGGTKAYRLLCKAMTEAKQVAIGRFSTRGREQLVLLRPSAEGLVMHGLFYADEVRSFSDVDLGETVEFKDAELDLAKQLIEALQNESFEPEKYKDDYRQGVLAAIDRKVAGEEITAAPPPQAREQIIDLVAALKKSIAEKRAPARAPTAAETPSPAKRRAGGKVTAVRR
jgi:DNA end-binding protein Ku